jgi:hypothetical protein
MLITFDRFMTPQTRQASVDRLHDVKAVEPVAEPVQRDESTHNAQRQGWQFVRHLMDSWFGALLGGAVYGAWAVWANWSQGNQMALTIGAAHWTTSALLTFFGTMAMRRFYGDSNGRMGSLRAFAGGLTLTYASLFTVHGVLGTQHLLLTLAPGIVPNILFCASYALLLKRTMTTATA